MIPTALLSLCFTTIDFYPFFGNFGEGFKIDEGTGYNEKKDYCV